MCEYSITAHHSEIVKVIAYRVVMLPGFRPESHRLATETSNGLELLDLRIIND